MSGFNKLEREREIVEERDASARVINTFMDPKIVNVWVGLDDGEYGRYIQCTM